jgi:hypothetical protein
VSLAEGRDAVQTLAHDRQHEPLRERVQVRTLRRQPWDCHLAAFQKLAEPCRAQGIPIREHTPFAQQEAIDGGNRSGPRETAYLQSSERAESPMKQG